MHDRALAVTLEVGPGAAWQLGEGGIRKQVGAVNVTVNNAGPRQISFVSVTARDENRCVIGADARRLIQAGASHTFVFVTAAKISRYFGSPETLVSAELSFKDTDGTTWVRTVPGDELVAHRVRKLRWRGKVS